MTAEEAHGQDEKHEAWMSSVSHLHWPAEGSSNRSSLCHRTQISRPLLRTPFQYRLSASVYFWRRDERTFLISS